MSTRVTDPAADAISVRALARLDELATVDGLFISVWGPGSPALGVELLRALSHEGGYIAGAYRQGELVGASVGFLGQHSGRLSLHSHATGVSPQARGLNVGRALKLHQRDWAAERGVEVITWTFDPLVRRNAWFNIGRLGAHPVEYLVDFYGPMSDSINAGDASDRLLMAWEVSPTPRVLPPAADDCLLIPTPEDIESLRGTDPSAARTWRLRLREDLLEPVTQRRIVGFTRDGNYVIVSDRHAPGDPEAHRPAGHRP
jgi:predicted GNAT superfamily acetyltransferase